MENKLGIIGTVIITILLLSVLVIVKINKKESENMYLSGLHHVVIEVKEYGNIELELDADTAPITVTNFINLAKSNFYDGLTFHRIMEGFMIQGGNAEGTDKEGIAKNIKGEFSSNGVKNDISHVRGVISMARISGMNDSASSQFFIMHEDATYLDGNYAAFGKVTNGMDVVDKIATESNPTDNNGTIRVSEQPVINTVKVID